jgi:flagellar hook-basal body complex protein FliE
MNVINTMAINGLEGVSNYGTSVSTANDEQNENTVSFDSLLQSAMNLVQQTEDYTNDAEEEQIKYATGESTSLHDLMVAQQKASVSLQYTVAVKNTAVEAYRSIMNMQF